MQYTAATVCLGLAAHAADMATLSSVAGDVGDLSTVPVAPPFTIAAPTRANVLRAQLRGGIRCVLGYQVSSTHPFCPWCAPSVYVPLSVQHIVRDCPALEDKRLTAWTVAAEEARRSGVLGRGAYIRPGAAITAAEREEWYRLTIGAHVSTTLLLCGLDAPASGTWTGTILPHNRQQYKRHVRVYITLLSITGEFLVQALGSLETYYKARLALRLPRTLPGPVQRPPQRNRGRGRRGTHPPRPGQQRRTRATVAVTGSRGQGKPAVSPQVTSKTTTTSEDVASSKKPVPQRVLRASTIAQRMAADPRAASRPAPPVALGCGAGGQASSVASESPTASMASRTSDSDFVAGSAWRKRGVRG